MSPLWTPRIALLLALLVGWSVANDVDDGCSDEDASFVDACTLCPCCATSMTSPQGAVSLWVEAAPQQVRAPVLPIVSLDAPVPPTPPPIFS